MKNIVIGTLMAVAIFSTPLYPTYAQVASSTEEQVASLREELISLLMQLIAQLQAQLDAQEQKDQVQDEEIEVIKKTSSTRSTSEPVVFEAPVDTLALARSKVGQIRADLALGEENIYFSVYDYLDADTVNFDANTTASSTEGGCNKIHGTEYQVCGVSAEYPIIDTDLVVTVTVNGVEKTLVLEPGKRSVVKASW